MKFCVLLCGFLLTGSAWAQEVDDPDDLSENTVIGAPLPSVVVPDTPPTKEEMLAWQNRPYAAASYRAAEQLKVEVQLADQVHQVCELIYQRKYPEAKKSLDAISVQYPTLGMGPLGQALIYQALMFENYDYRYEKQYQGAYDATLQQLDKGMNLPGNEALEYMVMAAIRGVDAIHVMRKGQFVSALNKAFDAMKALDQLRALAPELPDLKLADGMYLYWRSIVTLSSKLLPDFPDKRAEGLADMREAEVEGYFVGPAASLSMAYSYIEERKLRDARDKCLYTRMSYPDNVINNMTLGRIYTSQRRFEDALRVYAEVKEDAHNNQRVYYQEGLVYYRMARYDDAVRVLRVYLGFDEVPKATRSAAQYRLGTVYLKQNKTEEARHAFQDAVKTNGNESARRALARMDKK